MTEGAQQASSDKTAIRPFHVGFPEAELTELRRRVNATRWPERETVTDDSQGVRLAMMQDSRVLGDRLRLGKCEGN
jgi:Epoxide hydrolase N terminus.